MFPAAPSVPLNGRDRNRRDRHRERRGGGAPRRRHGTGTPGTPATPTTPTSTTSAGAGTPVQNGTLVSFTTTIGRIEPSEARTNNGQVRVRFISSGQSGTATITAFSGGASGKLENLKVGSAAAERVIISAIAADASPERRHDDDPGAGGGRVRRPAFRASRSSSSPIPRRSRAPPRRPMKAARRG